MNDILPSRLINQSAVWPDSSFLFFMTSLLASQHNGKDGRHAQCCAVQKPLNEERVTCRTLRFVGQQRDDRTVGNKKHALRLWWLPLCQVTHRSGPCGLLSNTFVTVLFLSSHLYGSSFFFHTKWCQNKLAIICQGSRTGKIEVILSQVTSHTRGRLTSQSFSADRSRLTTKGFLNLRLSMVGMSMAQGLWEKWNC